MYSLHLLHTRVCLSFSEWLCNATARLQKLMQCVFADLLLCNNCYIISSSFLAHLRNLG